MTNTDLNKRKYLFVCLLIPLTFFVELFTDVSAAILVLVSNLRQLFVETRIN